jgi:hypothetical protein
VAADERGDLERGHESVRQSIVCESGVDHGLHIAWGILWIRARVLPHGGPPRKLGTGLNSVPRTLGNRITEPMDAAEGSGPWGDYPRDAAGSVGPCGIAAPGRVRLGSGEDVRAVPNVATARISVPERSSMRWCCTRAHRASDDGAWARSHHEELAEKALTQSLSPGLVGGALLWRRLARPQ